METFSNLSIKSDDKDKLVKVVQNLSKFTSMYIKNINPSLSQGLIALSDLSRDSRKLFNLFRSLKELNEIQKTMIENNKYKTLSLADIILKISKFFFYLFDNLSLLSALKVLPFSKSATGLIGNMFYLSITVCNLCKSLYQLYILLEEKEQKEKNMIDNSEISINERPKEIKELNYKIVIEFVDITGKIGDLLSALNSSGVFQFVFGRKIKDGVVAFGGVWAGLVAIFQALKKQQK